MRPDEESFSAAVTNTFIVGDITYTLKLRANAAFVGREDGEVTMPSELAPSENGSASVDFTLDREPSLPGYTFAGWYADEDCVTEYPLVSGSTVTVEYGSVNTHVTYDEKIALNANDPHFVVGTNSYGGKIYIYNVYVTYEEVSDTNTFKIMLDYRDGQALPGDDDISPRITTDPSHTFFADTSAVHYTCNYDRCLDREKYEIVGWSYDPVNLNLDLEHYPIGHP